jgi:SAM-dependent methyltransferase
MRALGCEVFGTERPGPAFERAARIAGVNMVAGDVCEAGFDPGSFDLVTLWHVLEHLPDPFAAVQCCSRLLRDDGLLVVEVPNLESWQSRAAGVMAFHLDPPRHVLQFTSAALQALCARNGLSCCRRETASLEMGVLGAAQGWMNLVIRPRDLFYDILRTRNRCAGSAPAKALSLALAVPLLPAALAFTVLEAACGHGPVLRCFFRRAHRR